MWSAFRRTANWLSVAMGAAFRLSRHFGCLCQSKNQSRSRRTRGSKGQITPTVVKGINIYRFPWVEDSRGDLAVGEFESEFPFAPKD
jgi:hypothetical protein